MAKYNHEIRDPIHVFVHLTTEERKVLDSRPFQRLRHIHQLALTYLIYPGATHRRFEHSIGVMELAGRVYEVISRNASDEVRRKFEYLNDSHLKEYWRRVLRMAALVHDIGHLPFSHAAEQELLPSGYSHENLTKDLVYHEEMQSVWKSMKIQAADVAKLALGPAKFTDEEFSPWETILSEIIVGDAFGVDRIDYLLRDSHHAGVAYGKFDHYRLIDTLRILPAPKSDAESGGHYFALGVEEGGIQSAEALMLARYLMYSQVYYHPIRIIYDIHLKDFLEEWLPDGQYPKDPDKHLGITDIEVLAAMRKASLDNSISGHINARRIVQRQHFKKIYSRNPEDVKVNPEAGRAVYKALSDQFGAENFRYASRDIDGGSHDFPVRRKDGTSVSSLTYSDVIRKMPMAKSYYVFASRKIEKEAENWIGENREKIIKPEREEDNNG